MSYGLSIGSHLGPYLRVRYAASLFPGLLPHVVWREGALLGHYESLQAVPSRRGVDFGRGWVGVEVPERDRLRWVLRGTGNVAEYGAADWPEPRVVLVGESNPYRDSPRPDYDLYDRTGRATGGRLRSVILGVCRETYFRRFARHNLCCGGWSAGEARESSAGILAAYPTEVLVLLGRRVCGVFGDRFGLRLGPMVAQVVGTRPVVSLPHPSGRCRAWNDPGAVGRARRAILRACPGLPLGDEMNRA